MRLIRFGPKGKEKPGVLTCENIRLDLSGHFSDWNSTFFAKNGLEELADVVAANASSLTQVPGSERWGAPVARPGKSFVLA